MTDSIKKFLEEASKNAEFQDKLIKANNDYFQTVIDSSKELGISLDLKDLALLLKADKNHDGKISDEELAALISEELHNSEAGEDELANVAGGKYIPNDPYIDVCDCFCCLGGGGEADDKQKTCACVFAGVGELTDYGKELVAQGGQIDYCGSKDAPVAMYCPLAGLLPWWA